MAPRIAFGTAPIHRGRQETFPLLHLPLFARGDSRSQNWDGSRRAQLKVPSQTLQTASWAEKISWIIDIYSGFGDLYQIAQHEPKSDARLTVDRTDE